MVGFNIENGWIQSSYKFDIISYDGFYGVTETNGKFGHWNMCTEKIEDKRFSENDDFQFSSLEESF